MDPTHDLPVPSAIMPSKTWRRELNPTKAVHGSKGVSLPAPYVPRAPRQRPMCSFTLRLALWMAGWGCHMGDEGIGTRQLAAEQKRI
ncbi:hypothetical protein VTJ04DRAFT_7843 [Mycothermus thermophilus]|uniref:uncharacterized protein n=1 Tax=Humicola insolens TaxID=85995 RepID=UPI0037434031